MAYKLHIEFSNFPHCVRASCVAPRPCLAYPGYLTLAWIPSLVVSHCKSHAPTPPFPALLWTAANHAIACCIVGSCIVHPVRGGGGAGAGGVGGVHLSWAYLLPSLLGQYRADRFSALPSITRAAAAHFSFSFSFSFSFNIYDLFMCGCLLAPLISYENLCFPFWLKLPYRATQKGGNCGPGRGEGVSGQFTRLPQWPT